MLQIKTWSWNVNKPKGKTAKEIEKEINMFLKSHTCRPDDFEIFMMDNGIMFARQLYTMRKK